MKYLICFLLFLSIPSCRQERKSFKITDVSKSQEFVLECVDENKTVNSLLIEINGVINGNATITQSNGKNVNYKYGMHGILNK